MNVQSSIIRIVGLIGDLNQKESKKFYCKLLDNHFKQEFYPEKPDGTKDIEAEDFLRDYFYPDFRNLLFLTSADSGNKRFISSKCQNVVLLSKISGNEFTYNLKIIKSEVYIFEGNLGLFSLSIIPDYESYTIEDLSNILVCIRQFDTLTEDQVRWHEWISKNILVGEKLRGENIKSDEYSGSKFKLYSVIDVDRSNENRDELLYDIATTSPIGSAAGNSIFSPDRDYYLDVMKNKIKVFKNWEALCLFDSFTCIGSGHLSTHYVTWDYTYFRIYLSRLFFKYNIYRYNSEVQKNQDYPEILRNNFESFLNTYNVSHISFNFLANELFKKTGDSLEIGAELENFRERINNLSNSIKDKMQKKTNILLGMVTLLSGLSYVEPTVNKINQIRTYLAWTPYLFNTVLGFLIFLIVFGILYFIMPFRFSKILKILKSL